ncbi:MAG TPA: aminomethyltransferase family protein [Gemmataceae bacterium]|nr:aminomethyltransferase family protein [Gemmataceae bacterium]
MHQQTPLHEATTAAGATFAEQGGWLLPAHYGNWLAEYEHSCREVAIFDVSNRARVAVTGPDAGKFLHNLCTNDVLKLASGDGCEAFLTTGQAKIVAYVLISRTTVPGGSEIYFLDPGPDMGEKVVRHLDRFIISEQVELAERTLEFARVHLAGPGARAVLESTLAGLVPELPENHHYFADIAGASSQVRRDSSLGQPGYEVVVPQDKAQAVWQALSTAGANRAGSLAYETLRVEAGTPVYGRDIDETNLPQEVARVERTISFTKGCYIGQETVARIRAYGHVNRSLVGLRLSIPSAVPAGAKISRDDKEIGQATSSVVSPRMGAGIALAYVRRGNQEPGTALEVETDGGRCRAEVASLPFAGSVAPIP